MFWGLIMEPNKWYSQVVENSFHVSMASLDVESADNGVVQVILCYGNRNYLLCSLQKNSTWQVPLDLNFQEGTKIAFTCNSGHVHLTGYMIMDENADDFDKYEDESENEQEEVQVNKKLPKRKATESPKEEKELKRLKQVAEAESSDDDDDFEEDGIDRDDAEDSDDEDDVQEEEDEDCDDEDEEDEEDEDEEDEEEEENEKQVQKKPQQHEENKKKQIQEQQQLQQSKKRHDNQKLINGKEVRPEQQSKQQKKNKAEQAQLHQQNAQKETKKRVVEGGVLVEDRKVGNGAPAQSGKFVAVYSVGRLKNGKKIDSTLEGEGFKFRLGKGEVIRGWDVGIAGMRVGGKRRITIPPNMAYGAKGSPPIIPGNSTIIFDVELRKVY